MLASPIGGLAVGVGFMLPWARVRVGDITGYQAGYHVGFLGWLILSLGLLPALLACIPGLDRFLRQSMLRLLLSCVGGAFAAALLVTIVTRGSVPVGIIVVLLGFGIQILSALAESGLLRTVSRNA